MATEAEPLVEGEKLAKSRIAGIPAFPYPENNDLTSLETWCVEFAQKELPEAVKFVRERVKQYQYMKNSLTQSEISLRAQLKELKTNLSILQKLQSSAEEKEEIETTFKLSDPLYVKARLNCTDRVYLWIGAGVMCEYKIGEAIELLTKNSKQVEESVSGLRDDIEYSERQKVLAEITASMLHNALVTKKKAEELKKE